MGTPNAAAAQIINRHKEAVCQGNFACNYIGSDTENKRTGN